MNLSLDLYAERSANFDFQRSNMFSMVIASYPTSQSAQSLKQLENERYRTINKDTIHDNPLIVNGGFGGGAIVDEALRQQVKWGMNKLQSWLGRKLYTKMGEAAYNELRYYIGALSPRLLQSLLGEYKTGQMLLDFFAFLQDGENTPVFSPKLGAYAVKLPDYRINHEIDRNYNAPNIKYGARDLDPLVVSFRMNPDCSNYVAMIEWMNAIDDPVTGLRALPSEIESSIQITLHDRMGVPNIVNVFYGCVPVNVTSPQLSYEEDGTITTFDVTFAYRYTMIGPISEQDKREYMEGSEVIKSAMNGDIRKGPNRIDIAADIYDGIQTLGYL